MINKDKKLQHVRPGDIITADLINGIIDSVPKMHNPSCTLGFRETDDGLLLHLNNIIATGGVRGARQDGLKPYALRWMPKSVEDEKIGEWQVYLPKGCMQLDNFVCWPKNEMGTDKDGTSTFQWYKIVDPNDADAEVTTSNGYAFKEWTVYAHVKEFPLFYVSSKEDDSDFKTSTSIAIGTLMTKEWTDEAGKAHAMHSTTQIVGKNIDRHTDESGSFRITYKVLGDKKSEDSYHLLLTNQYITIGRNLIWIETDTDITSMTDVVLKIDHSTEDVAISIVDKLEKNTLDFTYIRILKLEDKSIVNDLRSLARVEFPFYNN